MLFNHPARICSAEIFLYLTGPEWEWLTYFYSCITRLTRIRTVQFFEELAAELSENELCGTAHPTGNMWNTGVNISHLCKWRHA